MLLGSLHGAVFILLEECCPFGLPYKKRAILVPAAVLFNWRNRLSFPPLITSSQPSGGKPWDMATFSPLRQPIMEVNWNSWVEMFAGFAQWGDCCAFLFSLANSEFEVYFYNLLWLSRNPLVENPHVCISSSLAKWDGDDDSRLGCGKWCDIILLWHSLGCQNLIKSMTQ